GTGSYYRGYIKPPEGFISTQLSGGLRVLYQKLEEKNKTLLASQTGKDVPLLAGRYKFIQVIGEGESSLLISAEEADCIQQLNKADPLHVSRTVQLFRNVSSITRSPQL
ncbi:hypothetical protein pdam_00020564, partial [Pocillopora damicornis]